MGATLEGTSGFNRMLGDLAALAGPGSHTDAAVRGEVGALVKVCIEYTPQATNAKIRARALYRFKSKYSIRGAGDLKVTMNDGSRGGEAVAENVWLRSGGKFYIMRGPGKWPARGNEKTSRYSPGGAHWPDRIWQEYESLINQSPRELERLKKAWIARALAAQGLARLSWLEAADALGIEVPGVRADLRRARASDGRAHVNGSGRNASAKDVLAYEISNRLPALVSGGLNGAGIVSRALATREAAFRIAAQKGLFADTRFLASRYPALLAR